jgi:O-acetyl-ADP-ribose deacetylase (regulator of RNase III)
LKEMRRQADAEGITSIAIPRIGVGYGGSSWKKVRAIVEAPFGDWLGTLVVYEDFVPKEPADMSPRLTNRHEPLTVVKGPILPGAGPDANGLQRSRPRMDITRVAA